jgi:hypothetical protein
MMTLLLQPASAGTAARQSNAVAAAAIKRQRLATEMLPNIVFLTGGVWRATPREALIVSFAHMLHIVLPH